MPKIRKYGNTILVQSNSADDNAMHLLNDYYKLLMANIQNKRQPCAFPDCKNNATVVIYGAFYRIGQKLIPMENIEDEEAFLNENPGCRATIVVVTVCLKHFIELATDEDLLEEFLKETREKVLNVLWRASED